MLLRGVRVALGVEHAQGGDGLGAGVAGLDDGVEVAALAASRKFVNRSRPVGSARRFQKFFNSTNRLRGEQNIPTHAANLRRYVIDDDHLPVAAEGLSDVLNVVLAWATLDAAFHRLRLLTSGVTHRGGLGSYTVMITNIGCIVVATI